MCGSCSVWAEGAAASLVAGRWWWVARQRRTEARDPAATTAGITADGVDPVGARPELAEAT